MTSVKENWSLINYNTFKVAANTRMFVELEDIPSVIDFISGDLTKKQPCFVLGGGSNVLFTKDFDGIIVRPLIKGIHIIYEDKSNAFIKAGAGEQWDFLVAYCVAKDWGGIENLSFIPGLIGASPVQNIGAYGVEVMDFIDSVEGYRIDTGKKFTLQANECKFSYRNSIFKTELKNKILITHVVFKLNKEPVYNTSYPDLRKEMENYPETTLHTIRQAVIAIRKKKLPDPDMIGNAGSFFKNPVVDNQKAEMLRKYFPAIPAYKQSDGNFKLSAAWLIDQCGWKGKRCGNSGTHKNQPLILINHGGATGEEILQCALKIQNAVITQFGIRLEMEVNIL
jgi:UDP-N-acetylmuramate dehydrogenase